MFGAHSFLSRSTFSGHVSIYSPRNGSRSESPHCVLLTVVDSGMGMTRASSIKVNPRTLRKAGKDAHQLPLDLNLRLCGLLGFCQTPTPLIMSKDANRRKLLVQVQKESEKTLEVQRLNLFSTESSLGTSNTTIKKVIIQTVVQRPHGGPSGAPPLYSLGLSSLELRSIGPPKGGLWTKMHGCQISGKFSLYL